MTAAATTGPASGPRPASSTPATGKTPRFIAARSRRKLGRSGGSSSGRRGAFLAAVRLMRRACCAGDHGNAMADEVLSPSFRVAAQRRARNPCGRLVVPCCWIPGSRAAPAPRNDDGFLLHLQAGLADDALGVGAVLLQVGGEFLRGVEHRVETHLDQALAAELGVVA